jgi:polyisoprenoid-binding protein YceI
MATWTIDPIHSEVKFKVKHLVVSSVTGNFKTFSGIVEAEKPDFSDAKISFEADVASVTTNNEQRDGHLQSADFFEAAAHPKMTFVSKSITKKDDSENVVTGDLSIRSIIKEIKLDVNYNGTIIGFGNQPVAGFEIEGKVNRKDYGMTFDAFTEAGGMIVGVEVKIDINVELQKQAAEELKKAA